MLEEFLKIADAQGLTGHEAFRNRKVHWFIDLDADGNYLGFSPTTAGGHFKNSRGKQYKTPTNLYCQAENGEIKSVCTNQHNWLPDFMTYPANEIFPRGVDGKQQVNNKKRKESWQLIFKAKSDLPNNNVLHAITNFLKSRPKFSTADLPEDEKETLLKRFNDGYERISFRVNGEICFLDKDIMDWWEKEIESRRNDVLTLLPDGRDLILSDSGKLSEFFPIVFNNIPFASFDKPPFESYGLGRQTTPLRIETAEKACAALNWLASDDNCHIKMEKDMVAVFWARANNAVQATGFASLLSKSDTLEVKDFFNNIWGHHVPSIQESRFYAVLIAPSRGRFSIYSWHTDTLKNSEERLKTYFQAVVMPLNGDDVIFSISELAGVTVRKGKNSSPQPSTYVALFETALFGVPVPHKLFKEVLIRQGVEMANGAEEKDYENRLAARTALIKLFFQTVKGGNMTQEQHDIENNPGYLCGRLLAMLDKIHSVAHQQSGGTNNSPANRVYSVASKTPALIFPRLCNLARHHLNKIGGGLAYNLEFGISKGKRKDGVDEDWEGLAGIISRFKETSSQDFPRMLSLEDQGRFAIGFYYERERCKKMPETKSKENTNQNLEEGANE